MMRDPSPLAPDGEVEPTDGASRETAKAVPEAAVGRGRRISLIWLIPLVAAAVAGWLAYRAITSQGPLITIQFESAEGLEAGQTPVKYKDVEVGRVEGIAISEDLQHIIVTARMVPRAARYLTDKTQFWIVRPRVGTGGVSGLSTLVSGSYIEIDPAEGTSQRAFTGLEEPPLIRSNVPGTSFVLRADTLDSVARGAPVYYRDVEVGQVLGYELAPQGREVVIHIFVRAPHDQLVRTSSRFWNVSGVQVTTSGGGLAVNVASLQALLVGGVAFDTDLVMRPGEQAPEDYAFGLFPSKDAAQHTSGGPRARYIVNFEGSTRGLHPGAPVEVRGIRVGSVEDVQLAYDAQRGGLMVQTLIEVDSNLAQPIDPQTRKSLPPQSPATLVARGFRAQLKTGNLLTGDLIVDLDFHPGAPPAELKTVADIPVIPSVPTQLDTLSASVTGILEKLSRLQLEQLVEDLRTTTQAVGALAGNEALLGALQDLQQTAQSLQQVAQNVQGEVGPLVTTLRQTADAATTALAQAQVTFRSTNDLLGPNSKLRYDLNELMNELTGAARSARSFADYLDRHPEALLRGRR
jgi:paraquat-inducible protein B